MDMTQTALDTKHDVDARRLAPMTPAVDILEERDGITLWADMPGVAKDTLSVEVRGDTLTIEGTVRLGESARLEDVHAEVDVAQYRRSFALADDLDATKIEASLANGVLELHIPKHEHARPRRIEVRA